MFFTVSPIEVLYKVVLPAILVSVITIMHLTGAPLRDVPHRLT